jgi:hypothetical protein
VCVEGQNDEWKKNESHLKTNNLNLGHIHGHNTKKMTHPKTQIISYYPSMTNIKTIS